jgi:hypothetical protein
MSNEVDLHATRYRPDLANGLVGVLGYGSPFNELHGFYVDAVDPTTATLPDGWQHRVHVIEGDNTIAAGSELRARGLCLDIHDLLVSKHAAAREKDLAFARAAIVAGYVDEARLRAGLAAVSTRIGAQKTKVAGDHVNVAFVEARRIRTERLEPRRCTAA